MITPLMNLFKRKKTGSEKGECCGERCPVYKDMDAVPRNLFDEDFPTSSALETRLKHNMYGMSFGLKSDIRCNHDGSIVASVEPKFSPACFLDTTALLQGLDGRRIGAFSADFTDIPKLPGLKGQVSLSNKRERYHVMTQYRHSYFSVFSDNVCSTNRDVDMHLSAVGCLKRQGISAGISANVEAKNNKGEEPLLKGYSFGFHALEGRANLVRGPWNVYMECSNFGKAYSVAVMRKVIVPYFTNEMLIAARFNARAMLPDLSEAESFKEKLSAVKDAVNPVATFAARTKITEFSSVKVKIDTEGVIGFSFSEQLSKWVRAVFALNGDVKNLSDLAHGRLSFTLTLAN